MSVLKSLSFSRIKEFKKSSFVTIFSMQLNWIAFIQSILLKITKTLTNWKLSIKNEQEIKQLFQITSNESLVLKTLSLFLLFLRWLIVTSWQVYLKLTFRKSMTDVSTTIKGLWMRWTTPFLTGMLARTISAITTPLLCFVSPATVFDFT